VPIDVLEEVSSNYLNGPTEHERAHRPALPLGGEPVELVDHPAQLLEWTEEVVGPPEVDASRSRSRSPDGACQVR